MLMMKTISTLSMIILDIAGEQHDDDNIDCMLLAIMMLMMLMMKIISTLSMIILNIAGEPSPRLSSLCRNTMAMPARSLYRSYISSITNHHRQKSFKVTLAQKQCPKH